jgi:hypothetical protein
VRLALIQPVSSVEYRDLAAVQQGLLSPHKRPSGNRPIADKKPTSRYRSALDECIGDLQLTA